MYKKQKSLSDNGIDDFLLVEYQDRIGGRMHDVSFGSGPDGHPYTVEAGANWVSFYSACLKRVIGGLLTGIRCKEQFRVMALRTQFTLW